MNENREKIFRISINYANSAAETKIINDRLKEVRSEINALSDANKRLENDRKAGKITQDQCNASTETNNKRTIQLRKDLEILSNEQKKNTQVTKNLALAEKMQDGSIYQLYNRLAALKTQYSQLSAHQRLYPEKKRTNEERSTGSIE